MIVVGPELLIFNVIGIVSCWARASYFECYWSCSMQIHYSFIICLVYMSQEIAEIRHFHNYRGICKNELKIDNIQIPGKIKTSRKNIFKVLLN